MNLLKFAFCLLLCISSQSFVQGQGWVSYQSQGQINDLVDTGDELLMATDAGLVVMNKSTLEKSIFNKSNSNLSNNHIQSIVQAPDGEFWIGTYDVVVGRFDGTDFVDISFPMNPEYNPDGTHLYDFEIGSNGDFWFATNDGVFQKANQSWTHYKEEITPDFFEAWDVKINDDGSVLIALEDIHKFDNGVWSNISEMTSLSGYNDAELFYSSTGDLYVAGDLDKIGRFDGTQWQEYDNGGLNGSEVIGFTEDLDGAIYFYTRRDGIFKLINDVWTQQENTQTIAFDNNISFYYIDEEGNDWMNRNIHLSVDKNGTIESTLISDNTIENNGVQSVHKGANGHMYFTTFARDNISVLDTDGTWSFLPLPTIINAVSFLSDILVIENDDIWLATDIGLYHYDGNDWTFEELEACRSFAVDSQGKIYAQSSSRVYIIENEVVSEYNTSNSEISELFISGIGIDSEDNLWVSSFDWDGASSTIQKVTIDGIWTTYSEAEHDVIKQPSGAFHFDVNGNVWIPDGLNGAIKFDGVEFTNPIKENLSEITNPDVYSVESDGNGKLYFSHQYGVTTLLDDEWDNLIVEDVPNIATSQGSNIEFDNEGTLWWASIRYGVFSYTPLNPTSVFSAIENTTNFSIYPNPAQDFTTIDFETKESAKVKAFVYNNLGQLQSAYDFGQLPTGVFQESINLEGFSKGMYTIQLQINNKSLIKKVIIQ